MDKQAAAGSRDHDPLEGGASRPDSRIASWFLLWGKNVRSFISTKRYVPADEADDLAQEVFLRTLRYSKHTDVENPLGYLLRIASNVAAEWRERKRVSQPHDSDWLDELLVDDIRETENAAIRINMSETLQEAVNSLPEWSRRALELHIMEGLTYNEIAKVLDRHPRQIVRDLGIAYSELRMRVRIEDI